LRDARVADAKAPRDFFISFNSADLPFAEAIDAALTAEGFSTFYHPRDLGAGGPNPNFTGRYQALITLHQSLLARTHAAITAFAGMGGIGKTTLAAEYSHRFGGLYGGVWWIRAEQEPVMLADLQALGEKLGIESDGNIDVAVRACLDRLKSLPEQWLLIYDNAPNPDAVRKWLPVGAVRCLITSRNAEFGDIAPVTRLDQWPEDVTADYLLTRTKRSDAAGAVRLAKSLGGLPLAAEQAAVYLSPRGGVSFDDYVSEIARLINQPRPAGAEGEYPNTVYAAFVKSLETVGQDNKSKTVFDAIRRSVLFVKSLGKIRVAQKGQIALDIVRLCSFLSPDGVDLGLLTDARSKEFLPAAFATAMADKFLREDALAALTTLSLLRQESGPAGTILIFHRLLLEVARDWMGEDARALWGEAAVRLVSRAFPWVEVHTWDICVRLMPHVAPLDTHAPRTGAPGKSLDRLLNQAGLYLAARGDHEGALALIERSVVLKRSTRIEEPLQLAAGLTNLAKQYTDLGRLEEAEQTYRKALEIEEPRLGADDPSLAITLSNLAAVHVYRKNFVDAEKSLLRAAKIHKEANGPDSAEYGTSLGNLDALYDEWAEHSGDVEKRRKAERFSSQALVVTRAARGERNPSTANRHYNLAVLNARLGNSQGAASEAERAIATMLSLDLAEHPNTRTFAGYLAQIWQQSGQPDKAARLQSGDFSGLLPIVAQVEAEHRAWIAKDPENRHFGPPSPFASKR
jgi:tetratricopeptide (TPR) repeat protein